MKLITERSEIRTVAKRWRAQYIAAFDRSPDKKQIAIKLDELDPETATAADVARIIGNKSWVETVCDECGARGVDVVEMGQEPDYESCTAHVCGDCLAKALRLLGR
jgi:hypothetical protein